MRIPEFLRRRLLIKATGIMASRPADLVIGDDYLERWYAIPRNRFFNVYLHRFKGSDQDGLHDHPWLWNLTAVLKGVLLEQTAKNYRHLVPTDMQLRCGKAPHRIQLETEQAITIFATGPKVRRWGFYTPQGWRWWRDHVCLDGSGRSIPKTKSERV